MQILLSCHDLRRLLQIANAATNSIDRTALPPHQLKHTDRFLAQIDDRLAAWKIQAAENRAFADAARNLHLDECVWDHDDEPIVSRGDDGAYVQVWRWISNEEAGVDGDDED